MHFIILSRGEVSLMHIEEMYIGPFPFNYVLIFTSPTAVTSHHIMSFRIIFVSEKGGLKIYSLDLLLSSFKFHEIL